MVIIILVITAINNSLIFLRITNIKKALKIYLQIELRLQLMKMYLINYQKGIKIQAISKNYFRNSNQTSYYNNNNNSKNNISLSSKLYRAILLISNNKVFNRN